MIELEFKWQEPLSTKIIFLLSPTYSCFSTIKKFRSSWNLYYPSTTTNIVTTFLLFSQSTPITATIAFLLFFFHHHHHTTSVLFSPTMITATTAPHFTTTPSITFHHYHHQLFIVFVLLPTHPFIPILFMRLRQKAEVPLALMYSCASLWLSCAKNGWFHPCYTT